MRQAASLEKVLWSIALPGLGQLLNGKYVKGILLIVVEVVVNVNANLNQVIMYSFLGDIAASVQAANFQWLLFYPCVYMFAIWDAYRDTVDEVGYAYIPPVLAAFLATVGIFYSGHTRVGEWLGPVWLPMLLCFVGLAVGSLLLRLLNKRTGSGGAV